MENSLEENIECEETFVKDEPIGEERKSNSMFPIQELLENKNYLVVLATNILLKIYRSSPDYAEFVIACLDRINDYAYMAKSL